eukprot:5096418-Pleurochrysis_carterae.AAC.1
MQSVLRGAVRAGGEVTQSSARACAVRAQAPEVTRARTVAYAVRVTRVVLNVGAVRIAATWGGVPRSSAPGVLASVGCMGVAGTSADSAVAAPLVSRVPPERVEGALRSSTCA